MFVSPTLVAHYIEAHDYLPPREYIEAVLCGDFVPPTLQEPFVYEAVAAEQPPGYLAAALGAPIKVVLLEYFCWGEDEPHRARGLRSGYWVYGPWDGSVEHARSVLSEAPMLVVGLTDVDQ